MSYFSIFSTDLVCLNLYIRIKIKIMKKEKRIKVFFTLNPQINQLFEDYIDKNAIDKSKILEILISEYLKNNGVKS